MTDKKTPEAEGRSGGYASVVTAAIEATTALVKAAEDSIVARLNSVVSQILRNIVLTLVAVVLALVGTVFALIALALWLGEMSGYGAWFGLFVIGASSLLIAVIIDLIRRSKKR